MRTLIFLIALSLVFGCAGSPEPPVPTELPDDIEIRYSTGAMHMEWGAYTFSADASGKAYFRKERDVIIIKEYDFTVPKEGLLEIYKSAVKSGFFYLEDSYNDPSIIDGGYSKITITADGSSKGVSVYNYYNESFELVEGKIGKLIIANLGEKAYAFEDMSEECAAKKIECEEGVVYKCVEGSKCLDMEYDCEVWKDFCEWAAIGELTPA